MVLFKALFPNALIACVLAVFIACSGFPPRSCIAAPNTPELGNSIRGVRLPDGKRLPALTFDLCEGAGETSGFGRELVEFLETNSVKATFFAGGFSKSENVCSGWERIHSRYDGPYGKKAWPGRKFRVAIDIGHSRTTPGALSARNRPEYGFNRAVALSLLRELTRAARIQAFIVNPGGEDITLQQRAELVNSAHPDLLVSIHHDSVKPDYLCEWTHRGVAARFCDRFWGYSLFISKMNARAKASRSFALELGGEMLKAGFIPSTTHLEMAEVEGHQPVDAHSGVYHYDGLVVLKDSKSPAVLIECGTIKNRAEEKFLHNPAYRRRMARAIRSAVEHFAIDKS